MDAGSENGTEPLAWARAFRKESQDSPLLDFHGIEPRESSQFSKRFCCFGRGKSLGSPPVRLR